MACLTATDTPARYPARPKIRLSWSSVSAEDDHDLTMNVDFKEQLSVERHHVEKVVEDLN